MFYSSILFVNFPKYFLHTFTINMISFLMLPLKQQLCLNVYLNSKYLYWIATFISLFLRLGKYAQKIPRKIFPHNTLQNVYFQFSKECYHLFTNVLYIFIFRYIYMYIICKTSGIWFIVLDMLLLEERSGNQVHNILFS